MKGMTIYLVKKIQIGVDGFNQPIYTEDGLFPADEVYPSAELYPNPVMLEAVDDCLVGQPSADDVTNTLALYGKKIAYTVGIPKGDTHDWTNKRVEWTDRYGTHVVKTFGVPITGIEANIPGPWHMKVRCEAYE